MGGCSLRRRKTLIPNPDAFRLYPSMTKAMGKPESKPEWYAVCCCLQNPSGPRRDEWCTQDRCHQQHTLKTSLRYRSWSNQKAWRWPCCHWPNGQNGKNRMERLLKLWLVTTDRPHWGVRSNLLIHTRGEGRVPVLRQAPQRPSGWVIRFLPNRMHQTKLEGKARIDVSKTSHPTRLDSFTGALFDYLFTEPPQEDAKWHWAVLQWSGKTRVGVVCSMLLSPKPFRTSERWVMYARPLLTINDKSNLRSHR